ncbi:MAG TPA: hypothetical protein VK705_07800 [Ferruginibacter sp.]|jgi:hypothetical protein|nr:hypothetical protein [Ferruginibacter sp.]
MKKIEFVFVAFILLIIISSCKKTSSPSIIGTWGLQSYKRATIDSNFFPALIFNSDSTFTDLNQYVFQFNNDNSFSFTDSLITPPIHQIGIYNLLSGGNISVTESGQSEADTIGSYILSGNTLQITVVGSTAGTGPTTRGSSFREIDTYDRK